MKITQIEAWQVDMRLSEPYTIAYETIEAATNIFIRIETDTKIVGFGSAAPDLAITGETADSVLKFVDDIIIPALKGADPLKIALHLENLRSYLDLHASAMAMVDLALYDIMGKAANLPVYKLLGGFRDQIKTSNTVGILPAEETVAKANEYVKQGFSVLKLKGGKDVASDIERVMKVREAVGKDIELRFDANQGYSVKEASEFAKATKLAEIEFMEQPTPKENLEILGQVKSEVDIPIMADESLMNFKDAFRLAQNQLVDLINIKLMKVGGLREALQIDAVARAANLQAMVGCMDEAALSIAAGLHLALAQPNIVYADLDGHLDLIDDPSAGAVILQEGVLYPTNKPGLGFDL